MALRGKSGATGNSSSLSITYAGANAIQVGDLIILVTAINGGTNTFTDPSGFTAGASLSPSLADVLINSAVTFHVAAKIAAAGDTGTPTYTTTANSGGAPYVQQILVYSGRLNSSVSAAFSNQIATPVAAHSANSYTYTLNGLTANAGDDVIAVVAANPGGGFSGQSWSASMTGFSDSLATYDNTGNFNPVLGSLDYVNNPGGATGSLGFNVSLSGGSGNDEWTGGFVMALTAATSPGTVIVNGSGLQSFSNTAGPVSYTTDWTVGSGNTLLVLYSCTDDNGNGTGIASVADGQGSYTQDAHNSNATHFDEGVFSLANTTSGTHVIVLTMNASAAAYGSFVVVELQGSWTFDASLGSNHGSSTTPTVTGTAPAGNDFQVALYNGATVSNEPSTPSGWNGSYMGIPASGWPSAGYVWKQSSSAAGSTSFGTLAVSDTWLTQIVGYKPAVAGLSIVAAGGSFAMTGEAVTLSESQLQALLILANPGAFNFQGAQAQSQLQLYALNTSYAMTGEAASFTQGSGLTTLVAAAGSYVMTGEDATLQAGRYVFSAFTGIFAMTGEAATLVSSGAAPPGYEFLPNYIGLYWLEGSRFLFQGGFLEISPKVLKIKGKEGLIVDQYPAVNTLVQLGTSVQFTVGDGTLLAASFDSVAGSSL